jgi:glycosyltransferase involved in cell wall biosynthesis
MYSKYLNEQIFDVHYFCIDQGLPKISSGNVKVHYQTFNSNKIRSFFTYFFQLGVLIKREKFDLIFQVDGKLAIIIRLLTIFQTTIFDIRTGDLSDTLFKLWFRNMQISFVSMFYKNVTIISENLRVLLKLKNKTITIIPLGGERLPTSIKTFEKIKLLYIGSLDRRNIHETVIGLSYYLKQENSFEDVTYDIVGFGKNSVVKLLEESIEISGLADKVTFHGRKKIDELYPFFEKCNIGLVYIPKTKAYDCQPSTKLFECLLAGMPVIATNTLENRVTLRSDCGVITEDNPISFANALERIIIYRNKYSSQKIKELYSEYEWCNIVKDKLEPYFKSLLE